MENAKGIKWLERRLQGMLSALSIQFLLGLALATVGDYNPDTHEGHQTAHGILLVLHMLVALGVLIGSIMVLVGAKKSAPKLIGLGAVGLVAILVSIVTGMARISVDNEWLTFLMGAGFIVAIGVYGQLLGEVLKLQRKSA